MKEIEKAINETAKILNEADRFETLKKFIDGLIKETKQTLLLQIEEIVEGMKKKVPTEERYTPEEAINIGSRIGYNQAIDDFTEKLNKLKE